ncbi:DUF2092 domain-containing protein [Ruegeria profundi]|uniref:Uncharacterized protein n=1 Tax=Ruegeria profundi TaxID=1685378 RepID=A0A0X3TDP6_9RHOB|nr:DUF2092 domain-containing protein [Ruegeria profundi]KUJ73813.1 hypothetical protein AVO44_19815 [Ruegeria profundi]
MIAEKLAKPDLEPPASICKALTALTLAALCATPAASDEGHARECDHLAFRTPEVDWQVWIAQEADPFSCRFTITSKSIALGPQYTIDVREWSPDVQLSGKVFDFAATANAIEIDASDADCRFRSTCCTRLPRTSSWRVTLGGGMAWVSLERLKLA